MNNFQITISAIDRATATVRKINGSFASLTRPIQQLGKSTKSLGRELGMDKMAKSIAGVARNAKGAATEIRKIGAPVLALVGGGSLLGIAALATQWGRLGYEVARTSETLGVSAGELQSLRGAAQVAGVGAGELTSGLKSLGDTMEDALYGRNQQALAVLHKLGISIHKTSSGAIDSVRGFNDMARAISNIKSPQVQGLVARQFGLEALLPLLRQGPAAIAAYQRKVRELGAEMGPAQVQRATNFGIALNYLQVAGQGLRNTIGDSLIPAIQPLLEELTNWISQNRALIGQKVGEWAQQFAKWVDSIDFKQLFADIKKIVSDIAHFVDAIGGWKVAAIGAAAIMAGPLLLSITNIGLGLGGLAIKTIPLAITGITALGTAMGGATVGAGALLTGLGSLGAVGASFGVGWGIGKGINWLLDKADINLGGGIYDLTHHDRVADMLAPGNPIVNAANAKWDLPKGLLDSVWAQESSRGKNLRSKAGALGQFQFMPATARQYGLKNPDDLAQSADAAGHMYHDLLRKYHGNLPAALAAYNWGSANLDRQGLDNAPPETSNYVRSIMSRMHQPAASAVSVGSAQPSTVQHDVKIELKGLPPGVTAQARKADGSNIPVRVASAMPAMAAP